MLAVSPHHPALFHPMPNSKQKLRGNAKEVDEKLKPFSFGKLSSEDRSKIVFWL